MTTAPPQQSVHFPRERRYAGALSFCRRHQLAAATCPGGSPSPAFLRDLKRFDSDLELFWHPGRENWVLYRVVRRAPAPSEDYLVKELEICKPDGSYTEPASWVFDHLRRADKTRCGSVDPQRADRLFVQGIDAELQAQEDTRDKWAEELGVDFRTELFKYAYGRRSVHVNRQ